MNPEIEEYLNGELSGSDLADFEAKLAKDAQLRAEVAQMRPVLLQLRRANIAQKVDNATQKYHSKRRAKRVMILSCAVLFSAGTYLWYNRNEEPKETPLKSPQNEIKPMPPVFEEKKSPIIEKEKINNDQVLKQKQVAKTPNKPPTSTPDAMPETDKQLIAYAKELYKIPSEYEGLRGISENSEFKEVKIALVEGRFQDGLSILNRLDVMNMAEYSFLRGHLLYGKGDHPEAYQIFTALANNNKYPEWRDNAEWYQLLSGIAANQLPKANLKALLNKIVNDPNHAFYGKDALKLKEMVE
jgi:hypothetical protein